jgi:hypothetical protein
MSPNSKQRSYIAPGRVWRAFGAQAVDAFPAVVVTSGGEARSDRAARLRVHDLRGEAHDLPLRDPAAVAAALQRDDLTRFGHHPLVLVSREYRLLAVAIGPPHPPDRLVVLANVAVLSGRGAVEIPGEGPQPSWLLFEFDTELSGAVLPEE